MKPNRYENETKTEREERHARHQALMRYHRDRKEDARRQHHSKYKNLPPNVLV